MLAWRFRLVDEAAHRDSSVLMRCTSTTTYSWTTAPAGHLAEHRREFSTSSNGPITERARFEPQQDAPTITLPAEGTQLDLDRFGVWPDLPRPAGQGRLTVAAGPAPCVQG